MPAPDWFFRFMYDRESAALERQHGRPDVRELDQLTVDTLASVVDPPGPVADLGCGPGAHTLDLARRGYEAVGVDASPRMIEVARRRATSAGIHPEFRVENLSGPLRFAHASLGGVLAILLIQHLPDPASFLAEVRRCLRPGGHVLIRAPIRAPDARRVGQSVYYRVRAALYTHVPGLADFYDEGSLTRLVQGAGFTVVTSSTSSTSVTVLARA